ncbi:hypothetical protein MCANUFG1_00538 [Mycoplasmopsis canis UFG1]|uniref:hypothetical protein n=1 Tax=Mycoplasmopsis canis TaxID=29555 RepID=UPI00025B0B48|nr:hypothetical protein [Mycoplasmopsis canis]EIE42082.1 hypothetical protein MCANUFG1_00538 [Mycoplasmopsis canis UFG1]
MKSMKWILLKALSSAISLTVISCHQNKHQNLESYNPEKTIVENIYKLNNNLWNSTDFRNRKVSFLVESMEMFNSKIISEIHSQEQKTKINNNWYDFSKQFNKIFEKDFMNKYHIIYYSNYSSREPIDSVEVNVNTVKIHHITYGDYEKQLISGQYLIFIEKKNIPNINSILINNISEKTDLTKYNNLPSKIKNKIWFSK